MPNRESGFTLIEMLIVIAIVGILGAVALPFYRGHAIKAKLTEVANGMSVIASAEAGYHQDTNLWAVCTTLDEIRNSLGVSVGSLTRISLVTVQNNGVITATVTGIDALVDNQFLTLTPSEASDGSVQWEWGASPAFPLHLRPKS